VLGLLGYGSFILIGWSGLLVPSLIRSIEHDFAQTDAGLGLFYFVSALLYATGSLLGGLTTERLGRRTVLGLAALLHGLGLVALAIAPSWPVFLLAALPANLGSGAIDGGVNGLFLDVYRTGRGRALNKLHLFFALGALIAPLVVGRLVDAGVPWQTVVLATAVPAFAAAVGFAITDVPSGRHEAGDIRTRIGLRLPLVLLALAVAFYVAAEVGVSAWLVRFLEAAPLAVATTALSLFWAGLTLGRLAAARFGDRWDHRRFAIVATAVASLALVLAVVVPSLPASIVLFGIVGFAYGPIYPMIMAVAGDRFPDRSAAVGGFLAACAIAGAILYPPVMGFLSVTVGLGWAMLGAAALGVGCAGALLVVGRRKRGSI
jgi:MFS transporter, FHS family, glucose/mannose:H+ symporter